MGASRKRFIAVVILLPTLYYNQRMVSMGTKTRLGLLFTGGEGPDPKRRRAIVQEAIPMEPIIAAADSGLLLAESAGLRPDWIIGDMDSLEPENRLAAYPPEIVLRYPRDKDYTDTELAFSLLREKGCEKIWIVGGGGGRIDHLFGIRSLFERDHPPERWITAGEDIRCLQASCDFVFLCEEKEKVISVFPLGDGPWEAESSGLVWPLDGLDWKRGFFGLSNRAPNGAFTVTVKQGRFFVMIPLE